MKENPAMPVGEVGAKMLERMNVSHAPLRQDLQGQGHFQMENYLLATKLVGIYLN